MASKTLAAAWAKLEARQHAWKEEPGIRDDMRRSIIDEVGLLDSNSLSFPENLQGAKWCKEVKCKIFSTEARSPRNPTFGKGGGPWNRPRQGEFRFVHCAGTWPSQPGSVEAGPNE